MLAAAGPHTSLRLGAVSIAVAVTGLLSGCGAQPIPIPTPATGTARAVAQPIPSAQSTVAVSGPQVQLLTALPKRPAAARSWPTALDASALGVLTPEEVIRADCIQADWSQEVGVQRARGIQFGARQAWFDPSTGTEVDSIIIHYATATGADSEYLSLVKDEARIFDKGSFTVPGIAESTGYVRTKLDSYGNANTLGLARVGDDVLRTILVTPAAPAHAAMLSLLKGEQWALKQS
jgi:hypothetical protein